MSDRNLDEQEARRILAEAEPDPAGERFVWRDDHFEIDRLPSPLWRGRTWRR
jgi:hypothetical protein